MRPAEVVPEFQVHGSAVRSRTEKGNYYLNKLTRLLAKVACASEIRLRVASSTVQV